MRRWFLSYHSLDQALAERLKSAIERKDPGSRVFFAPTNLRAGGSWSAQLAREIEEANAFILLVGEAGVGKWQVPEYDEALDKWVKAPSDFPLIVVLLQGQSVPGLPFIRRLHFIVTADPASEKDVARFYDAAAGGAAHTGELWRYTTPYRGLEAMEAKDSDFFFGRDKETVEVLNALANAPDRLPILIGNSGVGKSSLAQAGVLSALQRQAWPEGARAPNAWPAAFQDSRRWCFLSFKPGMEPLKALVEAFLETWQYGATDFERTKQQIGWIELLRDGKAAVSDLIDATDRRYKELDQAKPPGFFLYVDQGEELYVRAEASQRRRFSALIASALKDPRLHVIMSMRSDFLGQLQNDEHLFNARRQIDVAPLREAELREVVGRPAQLLSARFESDSLIDIITRRTAEDSIKDVGALPLLSYTLDDMWTQMVKADDGVLRLPAQSFELGGVLVDRADTFLETHPGAEDTLRRVLTLRLATVRDDGEPTRRRAARAEFSQDEWRLVSELADYPNRLLVTASTPAAETYAEVAHEAIFRRWSRLREWIAAEKEFLVWRSSLESARRAWQAAPQRARNDALLMGFALTQARTWVAKRAADLPTIDRQFIELSRRVAKRRSWRMRLLVGGLAMPVALAAVLGVAFGIYLLWRHFEVARPFELAQIRPFVLDTAAERALRPKDSFTECAAVAGKDECPQMVVVPSGSFFMGSEPGAKEPYAAALPRHEVTIGAPFAVSKYEVTFDEWDICVAYGDCGALVDSGFGRGRRPVISVSWDGAQTYVAWLSKVTGEPYRLLSEAEYEYAARAGTQTTYPWGDQLGMDNANCKDCGSKWDGAMTAPVGSFPPNAFGLYDMTGNVFEWVQDCWHDTYVGAPTDGKAWTDGNCSKRVIRGASWYYPSALVRSAFRYWSSRNTWGSITGFRVARTLSADEVSSAPGAP